MQFVCAVLLAGVLFTAPATARPRGTVSAQISGSCAVFTGGCCTAALESQCFIGGCFCDALCHDNGDCCVDIGCPAPATTPPPPVTTCSESGLSNGCCSGNILGCYVTAGNCFCDQNCVGFGDCCDDVDVTVCATTSCSSAGLSPGCCNPFSGSCVVSAPTGACFCDSLCNLFSDCCSDVDLTTVLTCPLTASQSDRQKLLRTQAHHTASVAESRGRSQTLGRPRTSLQSPSTGRGRAKAAFNSDFFRNIGSNILQELGNEIANEITGLKPQTAASSSEDTLVAGRGGAKEEGGAKAAFNSDFFRNIGSNILQELGNEIANEITGFKPQGENRAAAATAAATRSNEDTLDQLEAALAMAKRGRNAASQGFNFQEIGDTLSDIGEDLLESIALNLSNRKGRPAEAEDLGKIGDTLSNFGEDLLESVALNLANRKAPQTAADVEQ